MAEIGQELIEEENPEEEEMEEVEHRDAMSDLFEVPRPEDNDMATDHLLAVPQQEDLSDLTKVSTDDIMGVAPATQISRRVARKVIRRVPSRRTTTPTSLGGLR